ncbi:MAG TPA: type II secretion system major pseudopilin GspG [Bryobacteraceae bacterium]|nr:type II secretion system major pseudopilin GspG [Bryobacteraceae bacterium]
MTRENRRRAGVTLIEMMVVVTIIALFAALVLPRMIGQSDRARRVSAKAQINAYLTALGSYKLDTGVYPTSEQGLQALRVKPDGIENWQGPYTDKEIGNDPWGHPFVYKYPGEHGDDPDIISYGRDGQAGGDGNDADIVSWKN